MVNTTAIIVAPPSGRHTLASVPPGLLEPRLYRAAFTPALLALVVLAFSLGDPPPPRPAELAPPTFNAERANAIAEQLVENYGARESGSIEDSQTAELVRARLSGFGFGAARYDFEARTLNGGRTLANIVGVRAGPSDRRLLIVASRDGSPGKLERVGATETAILLELARVLQGRAFDHTLVIASVSGGVDGGLGAEELAQTLRGPVDGVLVVRNTGALAKGSPVLAQFDSRLQPDQTFARTVERIAQVEFGRPTQDRSIPAQLVRLAFPMALGEQATLPQNGLAVAAVSPGGEPLEPVADGSRRQVTAVGQTALRMLTSFDGDFTPTVPSPTPLAVGGKLIPQWALALLIGTLLLPLVIAVVDAWARARRWHEVSTRGLVAPALAVLPLVGIGSLIRATGLSGLIDAPPLPADPSALSGAGAIAMGAVALLLTGLLVVVAAGYARQVTPKGGEAGYALWLAIAGIVLLVFNPIAAGFCLLLLHLLMLLLLAGDGPRRSKVFAFTLLGLLPLIAAAIYYPLVFGLGPTTSLRYLVMLQAGGFIGPIGMVAGAIVLAACLTALIHLLWNAPRARRSDGLAPPPSPLTTTPPSRG